MKILIYTSRISAIILFFSIHTFACENSRSDKASNISAHQLLSYSKTSHDTLSAVPGLIPLPRFQVKRVPYQMARIHAAETGLHTDRLILAGTVLAVLNYGAYQNFKDIWWNYPTTQFHLYRGWRQTEGWYDMGPHDSLWFHMDKLGHYYATRGLSLLLSDLALWVGYTKEQSAWIGAVASWLFYLEIEMFDAQFEQWGFSLGDLAANSAGAFMPVLALKHEFVNQFQLKLSYAPSELELEHYMIEDYGGMTFWFTTNPRSLLPKEWMYWWPPFLNIALGYGVTQKVYGDIEMYVALDYDLTKIRTGSRFADRLLYYLNYIHFPAPTLKFQPATSFHLLYF